MARYEDTIPPGQGLVIELQRDVAECTPSELRALRVLMDKLKEGRAKHGPLDISKDKRNWRNEARAEMVDACWYLAFAEIMEGA